MSCLYIASFSSFILVPPGPQQPCYIWSLGFPDPIYCSIMNYQNIEDMSSHLQQLQEQVQQLTSALQQVDHRPPQPSIIRIPKPETFSGDSSEDIHSWLWSVEQD